MNGDAKQHWERVYTAKSPTEVSWYQQIPTRSLALIDAEITRTPPGGRGSERAFRIIDMGGGASTLVDHLIDRAGVEVCVVDIAGPALAAARERLGDRAGRVRWVEADATGALTEIEDGWADVWHDRAVFHFLTEVGARAAYAKNLARILRPGGTAVIAAFAPDGPEKCSGLGVCRHDGGSILCELTAAGAALALETEEREGHTTPWGAVQRFAYAVLRRQ